MHKIVAIVVYCVLLIAVGVLLYQWMSVVKNIHAPKPAQQQTQYIGLGWTIQSNQVVYQYGVVWKTNRLIK